MSFPHVSGVCPTTLMNQLLSLLPEGDHPETMFLLLFLDRLPPHISSQLTARTFRHPRDMAAYLDQIWDSTPPPPAGGGYVLSAALFLTGVHCLHAVCIPLESQLQPLPSTPPPTRLLLLPPAVWSGCTSLPGPLCLVRPSGGKRPRRR